MTSTGIKEESILDGALLQYRFDWSTVKIFFKAKFLQSKLVGITNGSRTRGRGFESLRVQGGNVLSHTSPTLIYFVHYIFNNAWWYWVIIIIKKLRQIFRETFQYKIAFSYILHEKEQIRLRRRSFDIFADFNSTSLIQL